MGSEMKVVLTKPFSYEEDSSNDVKASNVLKGLWYIAKDLRPGSDLTKIQIPPQFNCPKSYLQYFGELVYCVAENVNLLKKCSGGKTPIDRLVAVIAFNFSNIRPRVFGSFPYNPILGETHHVSTGSLNVLLEQISHHPPVTALHATDEKEGIQLIWCQYPVPKYNGTSVTVQLKGKMELKLTTHKETYTTRAPNVIYKLFPVPKVEWNGNQKIICKESGLEAELSYGGTSFFGRTRAVKGKIFHSSSKKPLFEINGYLDRTVTIKDVNSKETRIIYNSKEVLSNLPTPIVADPKGISETESAAVWSDVSEGIISNDWAKASISKRNLEENQRKLSKERESRDESWIHKHFVVSNSKEVGWDCSPIREFVPKAPIIVPHHQTL